MNLEGARMSADAGSEQEFLTAIIIDNQLRRIRELERKLGKLRRESSSLKAFVRGARVEKKRHASHHAAAVAKASLETAVAAATAAGEALVPPVAATLAAAASPVSSNQALLSLEKQKGMYSPVQAEAESYEPFSQSSSLDTAQVAAKSATGCAASTPVMSEGKGFLPKEALLAACSPCSDRLDLSDGTDSPLLSVATGSSIGTSRYWSKDEHQRYLIARSKFGEKEFVAISKFVGSRTPRQVRTHGEKYQKKLIREHARRIASEMADQLSSSEAQSSMPHSLEEMTDTVPQSQQQPCTAGAPKMLDVPMLEVGSSWNLFGIKQEPLFSVPLTLAELGEDAGDEVVPDLDRKDGPFSIIPDICGESESDGAFCLADDAMQVPAILDWQDLSTSIEDTFC